MRNKLAGFLTLVSAAVSMAQVGDISGERMRAHVKFLASDLLEGRGVGTRGEKLATEYIATQFALIGAKPARRATCPLVSSPMLGT